MIRGYALRSACALGALFLASAPRARADVGRARGPASAIAEGARERDGAARVGDAIDRGATDASARGDATGDGANRDGATGEVARNDASARDTTFVRGMTVSCQTWGWEWGSDGFVAELDDLARLGVNWVAIHPYARIAADGSVRARDLDPESPPDWIARPIREAHARGIAILVIPHVAYWGSPWRWRGEIEFADDASLARFFETYERWIADVARAARDADAFCVGNELDRLVVHDAQWRRVIAAVRERTSARLVYAANWNEYGRVPFWDALDAIGVQAYFPLSDAADPCAADLDAAWPPVIEGLRALSLRTGKPVVFTELGYNVSLDAARTPWTYGQERGEQRARAEELQKRCLASALAAIEREKSWLRGAFLWKWFVGPAPRENFLMKSDAMRAVIGATWGARAEGR